MIIFDMDKYIEQITKDGISSNDYYAKQKIRTLMTELIHNTSYKKGAVCKKVKTIADDYFKGLPDDLVKNELLTMYNELKLASPPEHEKKTVTLYKSEMETIKGLQDENLMKMAFVTLVILKFCGQYKRMTGISNYAYIGECKADVYRIAGLDSVSGTKKNAMWHELSEKGLVTYQMKVNKAWRFNPQWTAMTLFTVPFNVDLQKDKTNEEVYMQITNYDDILLYLRYYLGDKTLTLCADCGCPIPKNDNTRGKVYCSDCADKRKKASDNKRYQEKIA